MQMHLLTHMGIGAGMFALGTQPSQAEINAEKYLKKSKDEEQGQKTCRGRPEQKGS